LRLTEVTSFGSVLAFVACAVTVWLHILTLGVCVYCTGYQGVSLSSLYFVRKFDQLINPLLFLQSGYAAKN
jgi:formate-dependent nitrite reductase membrane component NrfD